MVQPQALTIMRPTALYPFRFVRPYTTYIFPCVRKYVQALEPHGRRVSKLLGSIGDVKNPDQIRKGAVALCATVQGKNGVAIKQ